jgi:hypothetical protein
MPNESAHRHPAPNDVQRLVDGVLDPQRDAALIAHVEACATCRAEVERVRCAAAALALATRPPADLLDRIRSRRLASERVILPIDGDGPAAPDAPTDDGSPTRDGAQWPGSHPSLADLACRVEGADGADSEIVAHLGECPACRRELEVQRHAAAALGLSSRPPADLFERIAARRAADERVLLPVISDDAPAVPRGGRDAPPNAEAGSASAPAPPVGRPRARRRTWPWTAGPVVRVAALALLTVHVLDVTVPGAAAGGGLVAGAAARASADTSGGAARAASISQPASVPVSGTPRAATAARPSGPTVALGPTPGRAHGPLRGAPLVGDSAPAHDSVAMDTAPAAGTRDANTRAGGHAPGTSDTSGTAATGDEASTAPVATDGTADVLSIRLAAYPTGVRPEQARWLDSVATLVQRDPARHIVIRYTDPTARRESESWRLMERVNEQLLLLRGVAEEQLLPPTRVPAVSKAGLPAQLEAIQIVVQRTRDDER